MGNGMGGKFIHTLNGNLIDKVPFSPTFFSTFLPPLLFLLKPFLTKARTYKRKLVPCEYWPSPPCHVVSEGRMLLLTNAIHVGRRYLG
jgi:hypothetical protein